MKKLFCCLLFLLSYLLLFPARALGDARAGLLLWYHSVLPVLFPFMMLCGLLLRFNLLERSLPVISRPFRALFGCSQYGSFAILTGFLCGFPMGAKLTHDLRAQGKISEQEACILYGFVNNLSPSFILSFLAADQMGRPSLGGLFLFNILGSSLLYGILSAKSLRGHEPRRHAAQAPAPERADPGKRGAVSAFTPNVQETFRLIDDCIYDTIQNTVRLGAYIVMFSLLSGAVSLLMPTGHPAALLFASCIEVSNGIHMIANASLPFCARYLLVCVLSAFGGLSALVQSASVAAMDKTLFIRYIKSRVIITLLSAVIALISVLLLRFRPF